MILSAEQRTIIAAPLESQCIIAGPGSGKTLVLTERIISLIEKNLLRGKECLALTFGVDASLELKQRLANRLGISASTISLHTIHALSLRILKENDPTYKNRTLCSDEKQQHRLVEEAILPFRNMPEFPREFADSSSALFHMGQYIRKNPERFFYKNCYDWAFILSKAIMFSFAKENRFLFDFLCLDALRIIRKQKLSFPYTAIFVDEFQDLNPVQFDLIKALSPINSSILTIVGDPNQAIFGWRGGDPTLFTRAKRHHPQMKQYHLAQTFRCPASIVEIANGLLEHTPDTLGSQIQTQKVGGSVCIHRKNSLDEELESTAQRIQLWLNNQISASSIAVLARSTDLVQKAMLHFHQKGIPVRGDNPFQRKEGRQVLALLHFLHDGSRLEEAINVGHRRIRTSLYRQLQNQSQTTVLEQQIRYLLQQEEGFSSLRIFIAAVDGFQDATKSLVHRLQTLFQALDFPEHQSDSPSLDTLLATKTIIINLSKSTATLDALLSQLQELQQQPLRHPQSVLVSTLHKVKGLEFSHVCILGNQNNIFPNYGLTKDDPKSLAEERRLLYVGITRAQQELHLSNHAGTAQEEFSHRDGFLRDIADINM